jgi:hypothetical protein
MASVPLESMRSLDEAIPMPNDPAGICALAT